MKAVRILSSVLVFVTLLSFSACSNSVAESETESGSAATETAATAGTTVATTAATSTAKTEPTTEPTAQTTFETTAEPTVETPTEATAETTAETTSETTAETTTETTAETEVWWKEAVADPVEAERPDHPNLSSKDEAKPYYIRVNNLANTVTVYAKDANGYHTRPIKVMVCSTGADTPQNSIYSLYGKGKWEWLPLFGNVYGRFATQITGDILFHSVPYTRWNDKSSLKYAEYDKLGTSCSMGCIRLPLEDAIWIYINKSNIASVEFYSSEDPGPLGKPTAQIISQNETCRGWDPTDTDPESPWNVRVQSTAETTTVQTTTPSTAE
ncbi:MAG: L,D-transpeptidase [Clostridia bacterium]|nr:L,D-transpeptidase [Clostridia bacterium]